MKSNFWSSIKHFSQNENWGDVNAIHPELILELDKFRELIQTPIIITCGTQGTHAENSYHYTGMAVDIVFPERVVCQLPDILLTALRLRFNGIGLYNFWKYQDRIVGGMHLDVRPTQKKALWISNNPKSYLPMDFTGLKTHFD